VAHEVADHTDETLAEAVTAACVALNVAISVARDAGLTAEPLVWDEDASGSVVLVELSRQLGRLQQP
jgi:hypothetical protein